MDTTPVAAHIVAGLNNPAVGTSFRFVIVNTNTGQDTLEISAGTGVTLSGTRQINPNTAREFLVVCTNVTPNQERVSIISTSG